MAHVRQSIRDNIATVLTGLATTAGRVYKSRVYPMDTGKLPGLCIYTKTEDIELAVMGPNRTMLRTLNVGIEAYVKGAEGYDDELDTICAEIETALASDRTRGGYAKDTRISDYQADYSSDGDKPHAVAVMTVQVIYHTKEQTPEIAA